MSSEKRVDVLATIDSAIVMFKHDPLSVGHADGMVNVRAAVAELIEAVIENREATQNFANNGGPEMYFKFDESERRVLRALANIGPTP